MPPTSMQSTNSHCGRASSTFRGCYGILLTYSSFRRLELHGIPAQEEPSSCRALVRFSRLRHLGQQTMPECDALQLFALAGIYQTNA